MRKLSGQPLELKIFGDTLKFSEYSDRLRRMTASDKRVLWSGVYDHGEVSRVLRELDIIVIPSLWYENSPNSILEALAHGTPVIASNHGGMAELVQHEKNGLVFEAGNPVDLAYQLQRLIDSPELLSKLRGGIVALKSEAQEIDELLAIYDSIVSVK